MLCLNIYALLGYSYSMKFIQCRKGHFCTMVSLIWFTTTAKKKKAKRRHSSIEHPFCLSKYGRLREFKRVQLTHEHSPCNPLNLRNNGPIRLDTLITLKKPGADLDGSSLLAQAHRNTRVLMVNISSRGYAVNGCPRKVV